MLRIQPLRAPRDENIYECVAENTEGEINVNAKLSIIRGESWPAPTRPTIMSFQFCVNSIYRCWFQEFGSCGMWGTHSLYDTLCHLDSNYSVTTPRERHIHGTLTPLCVSPQEVGFQHSFTAVGFQRVVEDHSVTWPASFPPYCCTASARDLIRRFPPSGGRDGRADAFICFPCPGRKKEDIKLTNTNTLV